MSAINSAQISQSRGNRVDSRQYWETKTHKYGCLHDRLRRVLNRLSEIRPRTLLDVGCSTGELARAVDADLPHVTYYGCDISNTAVQRIGGDKVVQCDINAEGVPFADRRFDCVVASGICEYVDDLPGFLGQLSDRLATDGTSLISYVNDHHVSRLGRRLVGRRPPNNPTWRRLVSMKSFERLLETSGMSVVGQEATSGRIESTDTHAQNRFSDAYHYLLCRAGPASRLLARQMIFVCQKKRS